MNRCVIILDGMALECDAKTKFDIKSDFVSTSTDRKRALSVGRVTIPATSHNSYLMGFAEQSSSIPFNERENHGALYIDDRLVADGRIVLCGVERSQGEVRYIIELKPEQKGWRELLSERSLTELNIDCAVGVDGESVQRSWSEQGPVKMLPVSRVIKESEMSSASLSEVIASMSLDNYHPFLNVASVVEQIFADAGYTTNSIFMNQPSFHKLYMSGAYNLSGHRRYEQNMGFLARKAESSTATADYSGSVYASPLAVEGALGNPVDVDTEGKFGDTYSRGECLRMDSAGRLVFVPKSAVSVSFIYDLRYRTDYRILSRTRLEGFDRIWMTASDNYSFHLTNNFVDYRDNIVAGVYYNLMVFNHLPTQLYRVRYRSGGTLFYSELARERMTTMSFGRLDDKIEIEGLEVSLDGGANYEPYTEDWALYGSYVDEWGATDVALTLRSTPEVITPSSPKYFDSMLFDGAREGMTLRLEAGVSIRPIFYDTPFVEGKLSWADVSAVECSQLDVVDALCAMFNLRVVVDEQRREARIESEEYLLGLSGMVDWRERMDTTRPCRVYEPAEGLAQRVVLCYADGDAAVAEWDELHEGDRYGYKEYHIPSSTSTEPLGYRKVKLFTPTINRTNICPTAPAASLIRVDDGTPTGQMENLAFHPKIVSYEGVVSLPEGQYWGWPSYDTHYPRAVFHSPESGFTLCFEDRDGVEGLHHRFERSARLWRSARRIEAYMRLEAWEVAALLEASAEEAPERNLYVVRVDGEMAVCTLERVEYTTGEESAKCTFIKIN